MARGWCDEGVRDSADEVPAGRGIDADAWYNLMPDLPAPPPPPLHPATHEPVGPDDLAPLFPMALIGQEVSGERYIEIPAAVQEVYRLWRPTPLYRAHRLERRSGRRRGSTTSTRARAGGIAQAQHGRPQAYYNAVEGARRLTTETGAGQWGSALAFACSQFGLECEVWMVAASYRQKPYRRSMMETSGATCIPVRRR